MRITIENAAELAVVRSRLPALAYQLGPTVELTLALPCGRLIRHHRGGLEPAARVASMNERLEAILDQDSFGSR
jgi:hypothetical protein